MSAALILYRARVAEGLPLGRVAGALFLIAVAVLAGGRAHFVAGAWSFGVYSRAPLAMLRFWEGLHAPGALAALALATPLALRLVRLPLGRFLDALIPAACLGIALARLGCFANGCCFGRLCEWGLCLVFPPGSPPQKLHLRSGAIASAAEWSAAIHPLPLYLAAAALAAAALGLWWCGRRRYAGQAALFSATAYLVVAGLLEPLREGAYPPGYTWAGRLQFEWLGLAMAALALLGLLLVEGLHRRRPRSGAGALASSARRSGAPAPPAPPTLTRIPNGGS